MNPKALILHATGTNRDLDVAQALSLAGATPNIVHLNDLRTDRARWNDYQLLVVAGGFSYADALGAGRLLALDLNTYFAEEVNRFMATGKPIIGICNGFQALVKTGILPDQQPANAPLEATLTFNAGGHFECRWVQLQPISQKCIWTKGLNEPIECPVAHGEGRFMTIDSEAPARLEMNDQVALIYVTPQGAPALGEYPYNPNGSVLDIAGICNPEGNVLGLMPHPENHIFPHQHPHWTRGVQRHSGLPLFINGVQYASQL